MPVKWIMRFKFEMGNNNTNYSASRQSCQMTWKVEVRVFFIVRCWVFKGKHEKRKIIADN